MKICLLGEYGSELDEGFKNVASTVSSELSKKYDVLNVNVKEIFSTHFWKQIRDFKPHIIHYLTAPTLSSFVALRIAKIYCNKDAKLVISSLHPYCLKLLRNPVLKTFIPLIKPDLILTQSHESEVIFKEIGCNTEFLPNGVDTERFVPASAKIKEELREKYGIDKKKFVILHVGHIKETRGIRIFNRLQDKTNQVIIVGSSYFRTDENLYQELINSGCIIWNRYFENIEEVYALADCYVFPVMRDDSIFMPLSVMEAMSCNLPVISTKYEGLTKAFEEGDGLFFAKSEEDFVNLLKKIKNDTNIKNREKVLPYSWEAVGKKLEEIYFKLISGDRNED